MKKTIIFLLMTLLGYTLRANPYPIGSQSWHNWNGMANAEAERIQRERAGYNNPPVREVEDKRKLWGVFIYNNETGDYLYDIAENFELSHKNLLKKAKNELKYYTGVDANREHHWKDVYATIAMGQNPKTGKWETIIDDDMKTWNKYIKQGHDETSLFQKLESDMLEKCRVKFNKCFIAVNFKKILELAESRKNKK